MNIFANCQIDLNIIKSAFYDTNAEKKIFLLHFLETLKLNVPKMGQKRKNSDFKNVLELNFATIKESAF